MWHQNDKFISFSEIKKNLTILPQSTHTVNWKPKKFVWSQMVQTIQTCNTENYSVIKNKKENVRRCLVLSFIYGEVIFHSLLIDTNQN